MSRVRNRSIAPIVIGVFGAAILIFLGAWQVQRLAWKEGLIAELEARVAADAVPLPSDLEPNRDRLLRVTATGRLGRRELHVLWSVKPHGPGYRIITPMEIAPDGHTVERRIMVDLGFVPERLKNLMDRSDTVRMRKRLFHDRVTGLLHWPNEIDSFTPDPDPTRNIWFARDVDAMAAALGTDPVLLIAESHPDGDLPLPRPPGADLPNRHLEYALTWFGLAIVWAAMSITWLRAELRKPRN